MPPDGSSRDRAERRALQLAVILGGLVPVGAGGMGVLSGAEGVGLADVCAGACGSHFRYLSGLLLGIGLGFWSLVPTIENQGRIFAVLTVIVVIGGLGRLLGAAIEGLPGGPMSAALVMELGVTPGLWAWQRRVARRAGGPH